MSHQCLTEPKATHIRSQESHMAAAARSFTQDAVGVRADVFQIFATLLHDALSQSLRTHETAILEQANCAFDTAMKMQNLVFEDVHRECAHKLSERKS